MSETPEEVAAMSAELMALHAKANPEGHADWFDLDDSDFYDRVYELLPRIFRAIAAAEERARKAEEERDELRTILASTTDALNVLLRENGLAEVQDPYRSFQVRVGIHELHDKLAERARKAEEERDELRDRLLEEHEGNPGREDARLWETRAHKKEQEAAELRESVVCLRAEVERLQGIIAAVPISDAYLVASAHLCKDVWYTTLLAEQQRIRVRALAKARTKAKEAAKR